MSLTIDPLVEAGPDFGPLTRKLSKKQLRSITMSEDHTVSLWVGAVSAGKTFASLIAFLIAVRRVPEGERIVIIGRTLKTIEGNVLSQLQDRKKFGDIADHVVHTRGASTALIFGRVVELIGAPNITAEGNIRGSTIGLAYVDEATLLPDEAFFAMLMSRLRVHGARLLATTNPGSQNHWLRKNYILRAKDWDMVVFHLTMRDNPSLDKAYVLRMIRANVGMFFQRFILGLWTNAAGAIWDMYDERVHVIRWEDMPKIGRVLGVAIDYGASHATSAIMLGITEEYDEKGRFAPRLVAMDEWRYLANPEAGKASLAPSVMVDEIRTWLRGDHTPGVEILRAGTVYADPSAKGFRNELARARIQTTEADNAVSEGISDVATLFATKRLLITDRCEGLLEEIPEYRWDPKKTEKGIDEPVKLNDDSCDALRYAVRSTRGQWLPALMNAYGRRF